MNNTRIESFDKSLNPVVGCTMGCDFCYAKKLNDRFKWIDDFSKPKYFPERLESLKSKKPQVIFMDSMSDIADWESDWIRSVYQAVSHNIQHKYLFLTKRPECLKNFGIFSHLSNCYFGTSITTQETAIKLHKALEWYSPNNNKFLSIEPMLTEIEIDRKLHLEWVLIGAETGNRKDKVIPKRKWIESVVTYCKNEKIPLFMKNSLDKIWEFPLIQEYPWEGYGI